MTPAPRASLRFRLPALISGLVLSVVVVYGLASYVEVRRAALMAASERLERVTDQLAQGLEGSLATVRIQTQASTETPLVRALFHDPATAAHRIDSLLTAAAAGPRPSMVSAIELWDPSGRRLAAGGRVPVADSAAARALEGAVSASAPTVVGPLRLGAGAEVYPVVARVAEGNALLGYLVTWRRLVAGGDGREQLNSVIGNDARLVIGNSDGSFWSDLAGEVPAPAVAPSSMDHVVTYERAQVGKVLASASPMTGAPWTVVIEFPRSRVLAPAQAALRRLGLFAVLLLLAGGVAAWLLGRSLTVPIAELGEAAAAITGGDYARRASVNRGDELGVLAEAFNTMARSVADGRRALEAHAQDIERQATGLAEQTREMESANRDMRQAVAEAERARAALEDALHDNATITAELNAALASAPVGFAFFDSQLRFRRVNAQLATLSGFPLEDHAGRTLEDVFPDVAGTIAEHLRHVLATGESIAHVDLSSAKAIEPFSVRHWLASFYPIRVSDRADDLLGVGVVITDLTSYKELEQQFLQAQKMEAIGRLAGGLAHDFNNMLTAISGFTQFAASQLPPGSPARADMDQVEFATTRAAALTRQLLAFSRQQVLQPQSLDLNDVVRRMETLLRRLLGADITLICELDAPVWPIRIDPVQIDHAIVNLAVNARDAMPHGGTLVLATRNLVLDATQARQQHPDVAAGSYVALTVADTGLGMTPATRARIFEPFFTTKEPGKGTGLGLATVHGIVKQSGGSIRVLSDAGRGTTFTILLPRYEGEDAPLVRQPEATPVPVASATVLLVDDEPSVLSTMRRTLSQAGYIVHAAPNGREGLAAVEALEGTLDLVVTDLVMPEMGGRQLARRLAERWPGLAVLFVSGYSAEAIGGEILEPHDAFLEKPFTPAELVATVQRVLRHDARRGGRPPSAFGMAS